MNLLEFTKNKKTRNKVNLFDEDCIPDPQLDFKILYKNNSGIAVRKSIRPCRQAGDYDKKFIALQYCDSKHKTFLTSNLKIGEMFLMT